MCYEAKWIEHSLKYEQSARTFEFSSADQPLLLQLRQICEHCWDLFHLSGYARIDFRVDVHQKPYILEINANPCLSMGSGLHAAALNEGFTYQGLINRIIGEALK
jgi:D-alanine-D-alanine ligase